LKGELFVQHEITKAMPLLNEDGNLREAGYAKKLLPVYNRGEIKANSLRIKEWDYYLVCNDHFAVALTIADNSYMGLGHQVRSASGVWPFYRYRDP
jgi:hypothetical protein